MLTASMTTAMIACGDDEEENTPKTPSTEAATDNNDPDVEKQPEETTSNSLIGSWKVSSSSDPQAPIGSIFTFAEDNKMTTTHSGWKELDLTYSYENEVLKMYAMNTTILEAVIVVQGNRASGTFHWPGKTTNYNIILERQ